MPAYFDAAYVAKCYLHEPDAAAVREAARSLDSIHTSAFTIAEVACVFHRHLREGVLTGKLSAMLREQFLEDIENRIWQLAPVTDRILRGVENVTRMLPERIFLRAGDAIHIITAIEGGFSEIWTNDRHLLAAAKHFGLKGRSV